MKYVGSLPRGGCLRSSLFIMRFAYVGSSFPWKSIWGTKAPLRVEFCVDNGITEDFNYVCHSDGLGLHV